jgi:hypothetical protein
MSDKPVLNYRPFDAAPKPHYAARGWLSLGLTVSLFPLWFTANFWLILINWTFAVLAALRALELSQRRSIPAWIAIIVALLLYVAFMTVGVISSLVIA